MFVSLFVLVFVYNIFCCFISFLFFVFFYVYWMISMVFLFSFLCACIGIDLLVILYRWWYVPAILVILKLGWFSNRDLFSRPQVVFNQSNVGSRREYLRYCYKKIKKFQQKNTIFWISLSLELKEQLREALKGEKRPSHSLYSNIIRVED